MGFALGSRCLESAAEAADLYYSTVPPRLTETGFQTFQKSGNQWLLNAYNSEPSGSVLVSSVAVSQQFPFCDNAQNAIDGIALGWLTITPAIILWCFVYLRKAFFT